MNKISRYFDVSQFVDILKSFAARQFACLPTIWSRKRAKRVLVQVECPSYERGVFFGSTWVRLNFFFHSFVFLCVFLLSHFYVNAWSFFFIFWFLFDGLFVNYVTLIVFAADFRWRVRTFVAFCFFFSLRNSSVWFKLGICILHFTWVHNSKSLAIGQQFRQKLFQNSDYCSEFVVCFH